MKHKHLHLDFDETLFNHRAMEAWMETVFVRDFKVSPGALTSTFDEHHEIQSDGMWLYLHEKHFEHVTGKNWPELNKYLIETWKNEGRPDFCYPEVHEVLKDLRVIHTDIYLLTYGVEEYQRFKISLCEHLKAFGVHVVSEPKSLFLAREFAHESGVLVDDKYPLDLPKHWQHVWINRADPLKGPKKLPDAWQISALEQLPSLLTTIVD